MVTYTVHEPPVPKADRIDRGTALEFVKDGFSWLTAIFPPLGFLANGLWPAAALYVAGAIALGWLTQKYSLDANLVSVVVLAIHAYLGFELSTIKRWWLERTGWQTLGVVTGSSIVECERRFLEDWLPAQPILAGSTSAAGSQPPLAPSAAKSPVTPAGTAIQPQKSRLWSLGRRS